jgi:hypothetical protein
MSTTIGAIWDRINSLVADQGFQQSRDHFDFDLVPDQAIDRVFRVQTRRTGTDGYLGPAQAELHTVDVWIARKVRNDSHGAARQLQVDLDLIEQAMYDDSPNYEYNVSDDPGPTSEVRLPSPDAIHAIARLTAVVDIDREL